MDGNDIFRWDVCRFILYGRSTWRTVISVTSKTVRNSAFSVCRFLFVLSSRLRVLKVQWHGAKIHPHANQITHKYHDRLWVVSRSQPTTIEPITQLTALVATRPAASYEYEMTVRIIALGRESTMRIDKGSHYKGWSSHLATLWAHIQ